MNQPHECVVGIYEEESKKNFHFKSAAEHLEKLSHEDPLLFRHQRQGKKLRNCGLPDSNRINRSINF